MSGLRRQPVPGLERAAGDHDDDDNHNDNNDDEDDHDDSAEGQAAEEEAQATALQARSAPAAKKAVPTPMNGARGTRTKPS